MSAIRRAPALLAVLLVTVPAAWVAASGDALGSGALAFTAPVRVGPNVGEPGLRIAPDGNVWVHVPGALYKSTNGGASFANVAVRPGIVQGGDADLAITRDGSLLFADLNFLGVVGTGPISVAKSTNANPNGVTGDWVQNLLAGALPYVDRQWLDAGPDPITGLENVYLVYNDYLPGLGLHVMRSTTGGLVFEDLGQLYPPLMGFQCSRGNVVVSRADGYVYIGDCSSQGVNVWSSANGGLTFTNHLLQPHSFQDTIFTIVTTDDAGNVYATWAEKENGQTNAYVSGSNDHGAHWTPRLKLSTPTSAGVLPWADGGAAGRVGVLWYAANVQGNTDAMPAGAAWTVNYAVITDFFGAQTVTTAPISPDVIQIGNICTSGTGCGGSRNLLDFIEVRSDAAGRANAVWADGCDPCTSPSNSNQAHVKFAVQTSGPTLR